MKTNEINKQSDKELQKLLLEKRAAVRQFRFDITGSKAKNIKGGLNMRKDVARILTAISARNKKPL
ncbi:MAG: 50S ribosomal protein L29 [Candidatus Lloydbacteria bacterium RIFCSPHIGHO2_02_FULL_50_13]|uniref:Large ribosomal subunit protein uL29 n=1 Tax=Candidatus Lloydbacteria bacterium RIFCSPHIGHO2_02_FULL_50_13 TaxID=1798661 RepID=A0A1G2D525_9BACT|nr:MAG: 50S ribosomal protein L29 [Candidatus Lloydbacteria bacterium RIFCSPHIGHO2_02_FULL_50_13]